MLIFSSVKWKNFLSAGNDWTEIHLNKAPSTLITGENGAGKCLHPSTKVDVLYRDEKFVLSIDEIYNFYKEHPDQIGKLKANTRHGYKTIEWADITAYDSPVLSITTNTDKNVRCSPDHRFFSDGDWKKAKTFSLTDTIDTVDGSEEIVSIEVEKDTCDLYDLQIEDVKEFYANDFVSHNSTFLDALLFGLYGRPYRAINKPQLCNSITQKNCMVEVEFKVRGKEYLVRRGIKPAVFEIYCDGKLIDQLSNVREYQELLEKTILRLNHKSFTQIVVIGSANFTPFMQLRPHERREIIEDLLDIEIFSKMYLVLKGKLQENKDSIRDTKYQLDLLKQKIALSKKHLNDIQSMKQNDIENNKRKIEHYKSEIEKTNKLIEKKRQAVKDLQVQLEDQTKLTTKLRKLEAFDEQMKQRIETLNSEIAFFEKNEDCPTCSQPIDNEFRENNIIERKEKEEKIREGLKKLNGDYHEINDKLKEFIDLEREIAGLNNDILSETSSISHYQSSIQDLRDAIQKDEQASNNKDVLDELKQIENEEKKTKSEHQRLIELQKNYDFVASLLKDSGIKSRIIRQYIPIINKMMNKYLAILDFFVQFELDENFNEKIKSRFHDEFTYNSFSEGEKFRLDIALLFTWRAVSKLRNSISTNLLVLDEVFDSSLDLSGTDEFLKMLIDLPKDNNVFVISHKGDQLYDKFHGHIRFEKVKNFSKIAR